MKTIYPWKTERRFNAWAEQCVLKYGSRIQKLSIDAGFNCPNRDGSIGVGGCTFCNNSAFNPSYCQKDKSISLQIEEGIEFHQSRYRRAMKYMAYFQAYSNTYSSLDEMKQKYEEALKHPLIVGISVGTRPDCIDEEKLNYLKELSEKYIVQLELGIESCYNSTLERVNRGHSFEKSVGAIELAYSKGLSVTGHIVFGLAGETIEMMMKEAEILSALPLSSLKFHQLQILKNTKEEEYFIKNPSDYHLFSLEEYVEFIIDFLERLNPRIMIERLCGEVPPRFLAQHSWGLIRNDQVIRMIEKRMEERDSWQGCKFVKL